MKKILLLLIVNCIFPCVLFGQECDIWIVTPIKQALEIQTDGTMMFTNKEYQKLMQVAGVSRVWQSFPYTKNEKLKRVYTHL